MDTTDWIVWAFFLFVWSKSFLHFSKVQKKLNSEGREFGFSHTSIFYILLLPWAIRKAEKDYREQENNR